MTTETMQLIKDCGCIEDAEKPGLFLDVCEEHRIAIGVERDHVPAFAKGENGAAIDAFREASLKAIEAVGFTLRYTPDLQVISIDRKTLNHLYQMAKAYYRETYGGK